MHLVGEPTPKVTCSKAGNWSRSGGEGRILPERRGFCRNDTGGWEAPSSPSASPCVDHDKKTGVGHSSNELLAKSAFGPNSPYN